MRLVNSVGFDLQCDQADARIATERRPFGILWRQLRDLEIAVVRYYLIVIIVPLGFLTGVTP
jgi:hypothetical protein